MRSKGTSENIRDIIDKKIGEVRVSYLDLSLGEVINLHTAKELIIQPEYQRLFRWSLQQQSRLIESVLLELPIPQIFLIEDEQGVLELIDGLQRMSSVIHFASYQDLPRQAKPLELVGCELVEELNGITYDQLPLVLQLKFKRARVQAVIIKRQSKYFLRYEMFKRLNSGGNIVEPQELRNCSARMVGDQGTKFYHFLVKMADNDDFKDCTETLAPASREQRGDEELVLRYLTLKNALSLFRGSVRDWLDDYMESVILRDPVTSVAAPFDYEAETTTFEDVFKNVNHVMGQAAFVKSRNGSPLGGLAPAYFEAVTMGFYNALAVVKQKDAAVVRDAVISALESSAFKDNTGPAANTRQKLKTRIEIVESAITSA